MKALNKDEIFSCQNQIHTWLQTHRDEIVDTLLTLCRIPSWRGEPEPGAPFGRACADMLDAVENLYQKHGFPTTSYRDGGYLLAYGGDTTADKTLGIFAHGDVVARGEDWLYTTPFAPIEKDGYLIGRGVLDDKAAIVLSLCCVRMIEELHLPFGAKLLCWTGFNEESGMQDIKNYRADGHTPPDFALVCDTAYPLYRGNKGKVTFQAISEEAFTDLVDFHGGEACNVTLGRATAVVRDKDGCYDWLKAKETDDLQVTRQENGIVLSAKGISRHGALPQGSRNAGGMIGALLVECPYIDAADREKLTFVSALLNEYAGTTLGIQTDDSTFGPLTCINGIIRMREGRLALDFNVRFGSATNIETIVQRVTEAFAAKKWTVTFDRMDAPHEVPADDPYIERCMEIYRRFTGDQNAKTQINAGGTYGMHLPRAAETGPMFWKHVPFALPAGHGGVHQADECLSIDGMLESTELTMLMLLGCADR